MDGEGRALVSTHPALAGPGSWSAPFAIAGVGGLTAVSCASTSLCVAVDGKGDVAVSTEPAAGPAAWHARLLDPSGGLVAVSCLPAGSCAAVDAAGNALASPNVAAVTGAGAAAGSGATWSSTAFDVFGAPTAVSCVATGLCVAVDGTGYAFASEDPAAAPPVWPASAVDIQPLRALRGVSCVSEGAGLCAAIDAGGRVLTAALPAPSPAPSEAALVQPHPFITGTPAPGQPLTCRSGVSASGVTLAYAWLRDTRAIAGSGGPAYMVSEADVSHHLQCRVSATTAAGSVSATSAFVTVPAGGLGTISETVVGSARAGRYAVAVPLTCSAQAAGRCTITLRLSVIETLRGSRIVALAAAAATRRVTLTVGARTLHLSPRQRYTATVALNATGRRLLARVHRMAVRLTVSGTVVGAISASLKSTTLTLATRGKTSAPRGKARVIPTTGSMRREAPSLHRDVPSLHREAPFLRHDAPPLHRGATSARHDARLAGGATSTAALAPTPYMGWDTYFTFGGHYDEAAVLEQASQLLTRGLAGHGYRYVWLDAGWWQGARDTSGAIALDALQWPHGMAWLARTLHAAGFRVGLYTDAGSVGCGGPGEGSYGHYQQDVNTFAAWGIDAVKVDFCGGVRLGLQPAVAYAAFHEAIVHNAGRRPILLSICNFLQPGQFAPENPAPENSAFASYTFGPSSGNSWRTNTDLGVPGDVRFANVLANLDADAAQPQAAGPGHWNDPDYLGPDQGMTAAQFRTQFSMWAMLAAPLMLSADLITLSGQSQTTVANGEAIAIDQDPAGLQARLLASSGEAQVWVKPLSDGSRAIALLNRGWAPLRIATTALAAGMPSAGSYAVRNVWTGGLTGLRSPGAIAANVPGGSTVLLRVFVK
ncbi:MAG TPA: glycoside hydrolase family 27 protein [Solirubrobacteraceae bacterium]|nr:glycoside hydrolase family 27 protein [Solirubrobacteraceae bacterium]